MARKRDQYGNVISSPKQKAVMLYGQRLRGLGSVYELVKHLKALGQRDVANNVEIAVARLKSAAFQEYKETRLALDPNWESPLDKLLREWDEQDKVM